ncbi:MAG: SDR family NAD(P)-dependent oxidoreductase [Oscillospiraceae bacterium]|nr:SDR family NAD(P)-dependent oxidoreductase [Oscillospiraceae bacterium]
MKTAVVTGASGGMGSAAVRALLREGYTVYGLDLRENAQTPGLHFIRTDLTSPESVESACREIGEAAGKIDCLVHMAGIYKLDSLIELPEEDFVRMFEVNLFSVYRVNRAFFPYLAPGARIVITSSELAPLSPLPFTGLYAVTKTAVEKYADALAMELQLLGHPVILLRPGAVDTAFLDVSTQALARFCENTQLYACNAERFKAIVDRVEARKIPPERIAGLVVRALNARHPKCVYKINCNPLLLLFEIFPKKAQRAVIRQILKP